MTAGDPLGEPERCCQDNLRLNRVSDRRLLSSIMAEVLKKRW
jgi:hypothetical protein